MGSRSLVVSRKFELSRARERDRWNRITKNRLEELLILAKTIAKGFNQHLDSRTPGSKSPSKTKRRYLQIQNTNNFILISLGFDHHVRKKKSAKKPSPGDFLKVVRVYSLLATFFAQIFQKNYFCFAVMVTHRARRTAYVSCCDDVMKAKLSNF